MDLQKVHHILKFFYVVVFSFVISNFLLKSGNQFTVKRSNNTFDRLISQVSKFLLRVGDLQVLRVIFDKNG